MDIRLSSSISSSSSHSPVKSSSMISSSPRSSSAPFSVLLEIDSIDFSTVPSHCSFFFGSWSFSSSYEGYCAASMKFYFFSSFWLLLIPSSYCFSFSTCNSSYFPYSFFSLIFLIAIEYVLVLPTKERVVLIIIHLITSNCCYYYFYFQSSFPATIIASILSNSYLEISMAHHMKSISDSKVTASSWNFRKNQHLISYYLLQH